MIARTKAGLSEAARKVEEHFRQFKAPAAAEHLSMQGNSPQYQEMDFYERLLAACEREAESRRSKRAARLPKASGLRTRNVGPDSVKCDEGRGLSRRRWEFYIGCGWILDGRKPNMLVVGATGTGKTHIVQAIGAQACRLGIPTLYCLHGDLMERMARAKADNGLVGFCRRTSRYPLPIIDDFMNQPGESPLLGSMLMTPLNGRCGESTTIVASQLAPEDWHRSIGDVHRAGAIIDRLVNNSHIIALKGASWRQPLRLSD